jgi:FAD synthetase
VAFSFNGGKDSTVLLHIVRAALVLRAREQGLPDNGEEGALSLTLAPRRHTNAPLRTLLRSQAAACRPCRQPANPSPAQPGLAAPAGLGGLRTFFFHSDADFPEITEFVYSSNEKYHLGMEVLHGDFKAGLVGMLQRSGVRAILLGTRK